MRLASLFLLKMRTEFVHAPIFQIVLAEFRIDYTIVRRKASKTAGKGPTLIVCSNIHSNSKTLIGFFPSDIQSVIHFQNLFLVFLQNADKLKISRFIYPRARPIDVRKNCVIEVIRIFLVHLILFLLVRIRRC
jgi:hypothetical membrane protein